MHNSEKQQADTRLNNAQAQQTQAYNAVQKDPAIAAQEARFSNQLDQYNKGDYSSAPLYNAMVTTGTKMRDLNLTPTGDEALLGYAGGSGDSYTKQLADDRKRGFMSSVAGMLPGAVQQDIGNAQQGLYATSGMLTNVDLAKAGLAQNDLNTAAGLYQFSRRPSWLGQAGLAAIGAAGQAAQGYGAGGCWVAAEIFGGWNAPKTEAARWYVNQLAPRWFYNLYMNHGEVFARRLKGRRFVKMLIRPLFEYFAWRGRS